MNQPPDVSKPAVQGPGGGGEGVWNQAVEAVEAVHQEPPLCAALGQHVALVGDDHIQDLLQLILLRKQTQRNSTHCWRLVFLKDSPRLLLKCDAPPPLQRILVCRTWQVKYLCRRLFAALFSSSSILTASSSSSEKILCSSTRLRSTICRWTLAEASSCRTRSVRWSRLWFSLCSFSRRTLQRRSS